MQAEVDEDAAGDHEPDIAADGRARAAGARRVERKGEDADVARFARREVDVLVGTQLVTTGHDFTLSPCDSKYGLKR